MENRLENLANDLKKIMCSDNYLFEIDTEDIVFGFKKTLKKRTNNFSKYLNIKIKLSRDCGNFISSTVRINAVRIYKNGELIKSI